MKLPLNSAGCGGNGLYFYTDVSFDHDESDIFSDISTSDNSEVDFTEYLWMENEEEFDKIEWQRLEEEELMNQCIEDMLEDEMEEITEEEWTACGFPIDFHDMCQYMMAFELASTPIDVQSSTLNPLAKEFVPSSIGH